MDSSKPRYWAIVPAAGIGQRFKGDRPKQYQTINGKSILEYALSNLLQCTKIEKVVVVIAADDTYWPSLNIAASDRTMVVQGGIERCQSVLNALSALQEYASKDDWVLVHDAARPCLSRDDLMRLIESLRDHPVGGLLGTRVRDTLKQADGDGNVVKTVDRSNLWRAQTPQMFRFGRLFSAMRDAIEKGIFVTDEASAIEMTGEVPVMVEGSANNIKVTVLEDLALIEGNLR